MSMLPASDAAVMSSDEPLELTASPSVSERLRRAWRRWRLLILPAAVAAFVIYARLTGLATPVTEEVRRLAVEGGAYGVALYLGLFAVRDLTQVPLGILVGIGILAYGEALGGGLAYFGACLSVSIGFLITRLVGRGPVPATVSPRLQKLLDQLEQRPVRIVAAVRCLTALTTVATCALALSRIRFRDYVLGCALGLIPPLIVLTLVWSWVLG